MSITVKKSAINRMKKELSNKNKYLGFRLGVKNSGCSGLTYTIKFADRINEDDEIIKIEKIKIVIDKKSLICLIGTVISFEKDGLNEGFKFKNPNVKEECGCGKSFFI